MPLQIFPGDETAWKNAQKANEQELRNDVQDINAQISRHVEFTLSRQPFNVDELAMFQASALSVRDKLVHNWNKTQTAHTEAKVKRVYI